jgi:hypothetical protein
MHCFKANEDAGGCATETARKGFKAHLHHVGLMSMRAGLIVTGKRLHGIGKQRVAIRRT